MGCIYSSWKEGCYFKEDEEYKDNLDAEGHCCIEEDESPESSCFSYESDESDELCPECGNEWISDNNVCDCGYCVDCGYTPCECEIVEEDEKSF